jgi:hypothetical protein
MMLLFWYYTGIFSTLRHYRPADASVLEDAGIECGLHTSNPKMFTIEPRTGALIKPTSVALHWPQESCIEYCGLRIVVLNTKLLHCNENLPVLVLSP